MNSPQGVTLDSAGKVIDVDPMGVIFNDAMPLMAAHMVVAAYLVGGFMIASVYAVGMLRGRRDRYHRLGFIIGFTVAAIATPVQMGVGDGLARWVYNEQPTKFAAIEMVPKTSSDVPEVLFGHLNSEGEVVGGIPIPGLASILSDPGTGTSTVIQGLDETPAEERPTNHEVNVVHLAWDVMVGLGTLLFLLTLWWWASGSSDETCRRAGGSCGPPPRPGCSPWSPGGGLDRQRGRPPAVDRLREDEGGGRRHREHRDLDHLHRRGDPLHRTRRHHDPGAADDEPPVPRGRPRPGEADVPYGPSEPDRSPSAQATRTSGRCRS